MSSNNKLKIYGLGSSTCTQRVIMSALESGADFEIHPVDIRKGENKKQEHLARQPFGLIPVLDDAGFILYESRAIARYVNDSRGKKLTPVTPHERGVMEQWISLEQGTITPEVSGIVSQRVFNPMMGGKTDDNKVKEHDQKIKLGLDVLDKHLSTNMYCSGNTFSLADIFFMPYFNLLLQTPEAHNLTSRPHIVAWWKRVSARPTWVKTLSYSESGSKHEMKDCK
jgi:glutathione S-transferase